MMAFKQLFYMLPMVAWLEYTIRLCLSKKLVAKQVHISDIHLCLFENLKKMQDIILQARC